MSLIPLAIGVPLLVLVVALGRAYGGLQRQVIVAVLGVRIPAPPLVAASPWWRPAALWARATDATAWRALLFHVLAFPVATVGFWAVAFCWFSLLVGLTWPAPGVDRDFELGPVEPWLVEQLGDGAAYAAAVMVLLVLVAVLLGTVATGAGWVFERLSRGLLGPTARQHRERLEQQRAAAVEVADTKRRRMERDLHDGAQVHLTSLALELGEVKDALARGVEVDEVADRCPVPTRLDVRVPHDLAEPISSLVYFTVAEALTNVGQHSGAAGAWVQVYVQEDDLIAEVIDDGQGGAEPADGTGLAGLISRARAAGGTLSVASPPGGPTSVRLEVPWRS